MSSPIKTTSEIPLPSHVRDRTAILWFMLVHASSPSAVVLWRIAAAVVQPVHVKVVVVTEDMGG